MHSMEFVVLAFPGSNYDRDMHSAAIKTGAKAECIDCRETSLSDFDGVLTLGGFSFSGYLRSGTMASVTPIISEVECFANEGKPVLGVCNGFQILTETGLSPGVLLRNDSRLLISRNKKLKVVNDQTPFTNLYGENEIIVYPVAHGEGHYYCTDDMYSELIENNQIILTYEDDPNGSHGRITGIMNKAGNVCGMMSHPERALKTPLSTGSDVKLFKAMVGNWRKQNV